MRDKRNPIKGKQKREKKGNPYWEFRESIRSGQKERGKNWKAKEIWVAGSGTKGKGRARNRDGGGEGEGADRTEMADLSGFGLLQMLAKK